MASHYPSSWSNSVLYLRQFFFLFILIVSLIFLEDGIGLIDHLAGVGAVFLIREEIVLAILFVITFAAGSYLLQLQWENTYFSIGKNDIVFHRGILLKQTESYSLADVDAIELNQGVLGRLLKYGTIEIVKSKFLSNRSIPYVPNPEYFQQTLTKKIH